MYFLVITYMLTLLGDRVLCVRPFFKDMNHSCLDILIDNYIILRRRSAIDYLKVEL